MELAGPNVTSVRIPVYNDVNVGYQMRDIGSVLIFNLPECWACISFGLVVMLDWCDVDSSS
jgi:hypothetical protein